MEPTPEEWMIALGFVAACFMFLVLCGMLLILAIADNIRIHIVKYARSRRKRGTNAHRHRDLREKDLPGPGHSGHQGEHA